MHKTVLCSILAIFTFILLTFVPNSFAQTTTPQNMVRLIYFVPRGRTPQPDINVRLDKLIKDVQTFYADEMERHGFGRKTFVFEADRDGNAVVHRVNGGFSDASYHKGTWEKVGKEIERRYDLNKNVYLVVVDVSTGIIDDFCGIATSSLNSNGDSVGRALIPASGYCLGTDYGFVLTAHELGHAFGLEHDFRNDAYIMSYGSYPNELALCSAEWFDSNRYFNDRQTLTDTGETTIEMLSAAPSPPYGIRFQFEVGDPDGLQIAQLLTPATNKHEAPGAFKLLGCKRLSGENQTVEFSTTELATQSKSVSLHVVDGLGNWKLEDYAVNPSGVLGSKSVSIPDADLAAAIRESLELSRGSQITQLDMLGLRRLYASKKEIRDLSGLEHARNLKYLYLPRNQVSDISMLAEMSNLVAVHLPSNQIRDFTPIAALTNLVELDLSSNPCEDISPVTGLTQLQVLHLRGYQIQDLALFTGFTDIREFNFSSNQISDLTPLADMTQLDALLLYENHIQDITPLEGLTELRSLQLGRNQISDVTSLATLTQLKELYLFENQISDVGPLTGLDGPRILNLRSNPILNASVLRPLVEKKPNLTLGINIAQGVSVVPVHVSKPSVMYWIDTKNGTLHRTVDDKIQNHLPSVQNATSLVVDLENSELYWTERIGKRSGRIQRSKINGSDAELVKELTSSPLDIALDTVGGKLYLLNDFGKIQRLNIDGTDFEPNFIRGLESPTDIALDVEGGKIYWTEDTGNIRRANLDGDLEIEAVIKDLGILGGIAVTGEALYWTEQIDENTSKIQRADLHGENVEILTTVSGTLHSIAFDPAVGKVYWTNSIGGIQRSNFDGSDIEALVTGLPSLGDFAFVTGLPSLGDFALGVRAVPVHVVDPRRPPMYWINRDTQTLHRLAGSTVEAVVANVSYPYSFVIDSVNGKLYWAETKITPVPTVSSKILSANLDGSNVQLVRHLPGAPRGIALDTVGRKLYLVNYWEDTGGRVQRLSVDGSDFEPDLITGLESPRYIALDVANDKVYWAELSGRIRRANLDGSDIEEVVTTDVGSIWNMALGDGKVYWSVKVSGKKAKIQCANLNGDPNIEVLITLKSGAPPLDIAVDASGQRLYWSTVGGKIQRSNLKGKRIQSVVTGLGYKPVGLALGAASVAIEVASAPIVVLPDEMNLLANFPNPFNPETWIPYQLAKPAEVGITIYAVNGQVIRTLALGHQPAGIYESRSRAAYWDGRNAFGESVASGVYFYTLTAGDFMATRKMLIRK